MTHRLITNGELILHGPVGFLFEGEGFLTHEVIEALAEMEGDIRARINSPGGIAADGIAIYNALRAHDGKVTTIIDGQALSAGAIAAMGGDQRLVGTGAVMMVHNAAGRTEGPASAHAKSIEVLNTFDESQARIFAKATGKSVASVKKLLDAETWMGADEAIKQGFATGHMSTPAREPTAFNYRIYTHAPERLVAMAAARNWSTPTIAARQPAPAPERKVKMETASEIFSRRAAERQARAAANVPSEKSEAPATDFAALADTVYAARAIDRQAKAQRHVKTEAK